MKLLRSFFSRNNILGIIFFTIVFSASAFAVNNLVVTGIGTPYAANGTYTYKDIINGHSHWKNGGYNIYVYVDSFSKTWWLIDNNTDGEDGQLFAENTDNGGTAYPYSSEMIWAADQGTGSPVVAEYSVNPEINISANGANIVSGDNTPSFSDHTKFGSALPNSGTATRTFTIQNTGAAALTVGAISFSGTNAAEFTVTSSPSSSVAASGSTTFTVTFTPTGMGSRDATISIVNTDSDENPYTFGLNGYGYTTTALVVSGITTTYSAANGNYISQGVKNNFQYWKHATENYYIFNFIMSGVAPTWIIDNDQDGTNGSLFYYSSEAVSPNGITTWNAQFGTGTPVVSEVTDAPEINLVGNNSRSITSGDNSPMKYDGTNFGSLNYTSGSRTRTFTIQNTGTAALTLSGSTPYVSLSGATSDFSVTTAPSNSIAASGSTSFVITFDPTSEGTKTAVVSIANNDNDESTYTFTIQGDGITPKNLVLSGVATPTAFNGTYIYQGLSNEFQCWKNGSYYIYNNNNGATGDNFYWYIDSDTDPTSYYFRSANNGENASPVNVTSWSASLGTGTPVIQYAEPEINITGNSVSIGDGDATPSIYDYSDFGWITSGTVTRTYTIQNLGTETLTLTGTSPYVVIGGTDASQFSITTPPSATIAAGGSTTFQVTFTPTSSLGTRTATLSIANNDADENPYNFSIQGGLGILPVVTTQSVNSITTTSAVGNGNITTLGNPNPTAYGICFGASANPTITDNKVDKGAASATGAFNAPITGLTPNTAYHIRAFVTNSLGTVYGADVTFSTPLTKFTLTTNATNGSITKSPDATSYDSGSVVTLTAAPNTGYSFTGWSDSSTWTTSSASITMNANKVVTANFAITYAITYNLDAGTNNGSNPSTYTVITPTITLAAPTKTGFTFSGWYSDAGFTSLVTTIPVGSTGDKTLYAKWTTKQYTLTTNATNGSITKSPDAASYDSNTVVQLTAVPNEGYSFTGWSDSLTGSTNPASIKMDANKTVTANFTINTYILTLAAGTGGSITVPASSTTTVGYGVSTTITAVPQSGYTFVKWDRSSTAATITDSTLASTSVATTAAATVSAVFIINAPSTPVSILPKADSLTTANSMSFIWNKAAPIIDKYGILICSDSGMTTIVKNDTTLTDTTYTLADLTSGQTYYWQVRAHNASGWSSYGEKRKFQRTITTAVLPKAYSVVFNGIRRNGGSMKFGLPQGSQVSMRLFSPQGKIVKVICSGYLAAGYHTANMDMSSVSNGFYILEFKAGSYVVKKAIPNM